MFESVYISTSNHLVLYSGFEASVRIVRIQNSGGWKHRGPIAIRSLEVSSWYFWLSVPGR